MNGTYAHDNTDTTGTTQVNTNMGNSGGDWDMDLNITG